MGPLKFEFRRPSLTASGEVGSLAELAGILHDEGNALVKMFGDDMEMCVQSVTQSLEQGAVETGEGGVTQIPPGSASTAEATRKPRKPRTGADPATASAPPPLAVPSAPPAPTPPAAPPNLQEGTNGIPAFLDRTAPPPPPLLPSAPPVVPAAPPPVAGPLGLKVIAEVQRRSVDDAAKATMVAWLSSPAAGLVLPGATFDEAIACLHMVTDDKMGGVAAALQIAA